MSSSRCRSMIAASMVLSAALCSTSVIASESQTVNHNHTATYSKASKLPAVSEVPAGIDQPVLRAVAGLVLKQRAYGLNGWNRLIVTSTLRHGEVRDAVDSSAAPVSRWEEFQVTTLEAEHGALIVYMNTLRRFESGPGVVRQNHWVLAERKPTARLVSPSALANLDSGVAR